MRDRYTPIDRSRSEAEARPIDSGIACPHEREKRRGDEPV